MNDVITQAVELANAGKLDEARAVLAAQAADNKDVAEALVKFDETFPKTDSEEAQAEQPGSSDS